MALPPYEELLLGNSAGSTTTSFCSPATRRTANIRRVGRDIGRWIEGAERNVRLSQLAPDFAWTLSSAAQCAVGDGAPHLTEAYFARHGQVQCYDILALPLANRWGSPFVAIYMSASAARATAWSTQSSTPATKA